MSEVLQVISFAEEDSAKRVYVDFSICSDILIPQEITNRLGILPTRTWAKGDRYEGRGRDPRTKKFYKEWRERPSGIWGLDTESSVKELRVEKHILFLLNLLEPSEKQIEYYLQQRENYRISFLIHWQPYGDWGSYVVDNNILQRMSALCHYIEFEFRATCNPE
jgi:hypothetical protein